MQILLTKNGQRIGNAILVSKEPARKVLSSTGYTYNIETDFGNKGRLTFEEMEEMFFWGPPMDYKEWHARRVENVFPNDGK